MTHALWTGELVETFHEPSFPNHLALFEASEKQDVIVQYDELSPWRDSERRRTYFLRENLNRLQTRKAPRFAEANATNHSTPIPVLIDPDSTADHQPSPGSYATTTIDGNAFTIYRTNAPPDGPYRLPAYRTATGDLKIVLLTPVTVTLDASLVGGFVAYWIIYGLASAGHGVIYQSR